VGGSSFFASLLVVAWTTAPSVAVSRLVGLALASLVADAGDLGRRLQWHARVFLLLLRSFLDGGGLGGFFDRYLTVVVLLLRISCSTVEVVGPVSSSGSCSGWAVAPPLLVSSSAAAEDAVGEDPLLGFCVRLIELVADDGRFGFGSPEVSSVTADSVLPWLISIKVGRWNVLQSHSFVSLTSAKGRGSVTASPTVVSMMAGGWSGRRLFERRC
jgi:hypothetical protein